jgi:hypothetical protein
VNRAEHLMTTAAEEACEVGQRITKALRFGMSEIQPGQPLTNAERIVAEFHDLFVMMEWLIAEGRLPADTRLVPDVKTSQAKRAKVEKFMAIGREQGVLSDA